MLVKGLDLDEETRCRHWHSEKDIIAIQFACCGEFYACYECHQELADHPAEPWPAVAFAKAEAVYCGKCKTRMTIKAYMESEGQCPNCGAAFNPGCEKHWHLYFEVEKKL